MRVYPDVGAIRETFPQFVVAAITGAARVKASITLAADAPYFAGHFPGRPILPGVVELAMMVETAARVSSTR